MVSLPEKWSDVTSQKAVIMGLGRYAFRREYSAAHLGAIGFTNIEQVNSFDGFENDVDTALKELGIQFSPSLGKGHKGCCYTHMREIKRMIDEEAPFRVFFEDDALGHLDLSNGLGQKFWDATPKDFDMLYLGNMMNVADPALNSPDALVVQRPTYCMHAYMLTLKGAKHIWDLAKQINAAGENLIMLDIQMVMWQTQNKMNWQCWNGCWTQKSFPTFDEGLPWQAFPDIITPQKDTGLFWQNMRLGTTLAFPTLQITIPQYST
jgi:GR25 family glycosyltransferase involved in LPS biosynthesis